MRRLLLMALSMMAMAPGLASAEGPSPTPAPVAAPQRSPAPDFFFAPPRGSFSVRGSWDVLQANSDWFGFVRQQLTLDRGDFSLFGIAGDVNVSLTPRFDLVVGADYFGQSTDSEYRDFVDNLRQPIQQTTRLREGSVTGGVRYALRERGRAISSLAWIPTRIVPYVGGGGGFIWYNLEQYGDFVDFTDFSVFGDLLPSNGIGPTAYVQAGADVQLVKRLYVTFDARYKWAKSQLDDVVWTGFDPLNLGGVKLSTGLSFSF
jgi:hypothetical protein